MPTTIGKIYLGSTLVAGGGSSVSTTEWVRNPAWPILTAPLATEQKIVGLHAVWPGDGVGKGGNFFAFLAQGAYTIDYGDGTVTNYSSNTRADYEFDFNNPQLDGTNAPVTLDVTSSLVNRTAHGLINGSKISFYQLTNTTGIVAERVYYVVNATANSFQVSESAGGAAISLTGSNGTASLLPYKVATVTITPQAGQNLTVVNFFQKNGTTGLVNGYCTGWLDLAMAISQCSGADLTIGGQGTVAHGLVERIDIVAVGALTSFVNLFNGCRELQSIPSLPNATAVTNMSNMFNGCYSLQTIPPFPGSVAAVTNMSNMFLNCTSLQTIPPFPGSVAAVTSMSFMFNGCYSLQTIPPFPGSVAAVTNMGNMFNGCTSLQTIPPFPGSVAAVISMGFMFNGCTSLQTIPPFPGSVAAVIGMNSMFQGCTSLQTIPPFPGSVAAVTNMGNMFNGCYSLQTIPPFPGSVAAVTAMNSMFQNCTSLQTISPFPGSVAAVTGMGGMFLGCTSLQTIPPFPGSVAAVTNMGNMFNGCTSLQTIPPMNTSGVSSAANLSSAFLGGNLTRIQATGQRFSFSVANQKLSAAALNELFTGLPTVTGQTITVTGNYGISEAGYSPAIATAKGWTVTA
jgi:hypothetical protein